MSKNTMYAGRVFDSTVVQNGTPQTSPPVRMDAAVTMSIETKAFTTAGSLNVTYTYELSSDGDPNGVWTTPSAPVTIGTHTVLDISDFAPEAAKYIRIIATNGDASDVTLTTVLHMQES